MGTAVKEKRAFTPISGHPALDLLATLRDRHRQPTECLRDAVDLDRWLVAVDLPVEQRATEDDLVAVRRLREIIYGLTRRLLDEGETPLKELEALNDWARRTPLAPQIGKGFERRWHGDAQAALALIAREAVALFSSSDRELIRECAARPNCSRIYLDRSPGQRRRWCHMEWCGSNAKMRDYRRRVSTATSPEPPSRHS